MVTHDPRYARHAERMIHLFDGRVVDELPDASPRADDPGWQPAPGTA
jgi:ABC-type siderophore export system fused ATPase/permease subunit